MIPDDVKVGDMVLKLLPSFHLLLWGINVNRNSDLNKERLLFGYVKKKTKRAKRDFYVIEWYKDGHPVQQEHSSYQTQCYRDFYITLYNG